MRSDHADGRVLPVLGVLGSPLLLKFKGEHDGHAPGSKRTIGQGAAHPAQAAHGRSSSPGYRRGLSRRGKPRAEPPTGWCACHDTFVEVGTLPGIGYRCMRGCPAEPFLERRLRQRGQRPPSWPPRPAGAQRDPPGAKVKRAYSPDELTARSRKRPDAGGSARASAPKRWPKPKRKPVAVPKVKDQIRPQPAQPPRQNRPVPRGFKRDLGQNRRVSRALLNHGVGSGPPQASQPRG